MSVPVAVVCFASLWMKSIGVDVAIFTATCGGAQLRGFPAYSACSESTNNPLKKTEYTQSKEHKNVKND